MQRDSLPYFDFLLDLIARRNNVAISGFGRHVHWGYWPDPRRATGDDADFARASERLTAELCALAGIAPGQQVLDAGCGFGGTIAYLNEQVAQLELTGLNIDARQLQRARELVAPRAGTRVDFCVGDACVLPFADQSFDRVLAVECIFHFPSRLDFLREVRRVLRPGGTLALSDFVPAAFYAPAVNLVAKSAWFRRLNYFGHCDVSCTLPHYRKLAAEAGLEVVVERKVTRHIQPTYRYVRACLNDEQITGRRLPGASLLILLLQALGALEVLNYCFLSFRRPD
ncbi:MAG: methyltransferase domain-containing protein [Rhodocyclaceae bacterium]|nr:methyltransferase domain-containing protein [Rhodocyclaceae bacterium]MBX3669670.1 methyltransferase domain-containing protein [Rhodocyclaceae bacterium]